MKRKFICGFLFSLSPALLFAQQPASVTPDTSYANGLTWEEVGGPACGYMISFTHNRNMPPGDQFYIEENITLFCTGTSTGWFKVLGGPNYSENWYNNDSPGYYWDGNSYGTVTSYARISPAMCSIAHADFRFVYVSANGSGNWHVSFSNMTYYLDHPPVLNDPSNYFVNSACDIPQTVNFPITSNSCGCPLLITVQYGDGGSFSYYPPPTGMYFTDTLQHTYNSPGIYSVKYRVSCDIFNSVYTEKTKYNFVQIGPDSCSNVGGKLYADLNSNCIFDTGDSVLISYPVRITVNGQSQYYAITDSSGNYSFILPDTANTYHIYFDAANFGMQNICPLNGYPVPSLPSLQNDFAVNCQSTFDLTGYFYTSRFTPGVLTSIFIKGENLNCNPVNAQVKLVKDPLLAYVSSQIPPSGINGDTLTWDYNNASFFNPFVNNLTVQPDSQATPNDTICLQLIIEPMSTDFNPNNNILESCKVVNTSADPNDKEVKTYLSTDGTVQDPSLIYTINFQNTGTAYARNIFILDTLNGKLDVNSFRIISASHKVKTDIFNGHVIKFRFENIMLPDSNDNKQASKGFIAYSIKPKLNPASESVIKNKAYIYFDFNAAVPTNMTYYRVQDFSSAANSAKQTGIQIIPNPFSEFFELVFPAFENEKPAELVLVNMLGVELKHIKVTGIKTYVSGNNFPAGMYFYYLKQQNNILSKGKFIVE
ncbi:MAG: T9SS type A sorting domain-containing protein [Bacteroidia bacterium]